MQPIVLGPNMPAMFYRGDGRIDRLRGTSRARGPARGLDRVGHGAVRQPRPTGMTRLPDGTLLSGGGRQRPGGLAGRGRTWPRYGTDTGLLVKLLDAGQRLPVHVHPDRSFAAEHLARPHGKTEAWVVLEADPDAAVYLGFSRDVGAAELAGWARDQDVEAMLAVTNRVPVARGRHRAVPGRDAARHQRRDPRRRAAGTRRPVDHAGVEHLLPAGRRGDARPATGGGARRASTGARARRSGSAELHGRSLNSAVGSLLPDEADPFFLAERVDTQVSLASVAELQRARGHRRRGPPGHRGRLVPA